MKTIVFAGGLALLGTLLGTRLAIRILVQKGYGQLIRDDGPTSHHVKRGTPTMGGLVIIAAVLGDMLELGPGAAAEHRALGAYAVGRGVTRIVAVGEFADEVAAGALSGAGGVRSEVAADRDDAVRRVLADLAAGDVVLVKASRGLALDTVAAAVAAADPVGPDDEQGEDGA